MGIETVGTYYDTLIEKGIATKEEVSLVTSIHGLNLETMQLILFVRTGYRNLEQMVECEGE